LNLIIKKIKKPKLENEIVEITEEIINLNKKTKNELKLMCKKKKFKN
jgi:hypothetical protein